MNNLVGDVTVNPRDLYRYINSKKKKKKKTGKVFHPLKRRGRGGGGSGGGEWSCRIRL